MAFVRFLCPSETAVLDEPLGVCILHPLGVFLHEQAVQLVVGNGSRILGAEEVGIIVDIHFWGFYFSQGKWIIVLGVLTITNRLLGII